MIWNDEANIKMVDSIVVTNLVFLANTGTWLCCSLRDPSMEVHQFYHLSRQTIHTIYFWASTATCVRIHLHVYWGILNATMVQHFHPLTKWAVQLEHWQIFWHVQVMVALPKLTAHYILFVLYAMYAHHMHSMMPLHNTYVFHDMNKLCRGI